MRLGDCLPTTAAVELCGQVGLSLRLAPLRQVPRPRGTELGPGHEAEGTVVLELALDDGGVERAKGGDAPMRGVPEDPQGVRDEELDGRRQCHGVIVHGAL